MSTDVLDGLDMPESEAGTPEPVAPEPNVDLTPPADKAPQARADDGKFKGKEGEAKPNSADTKPNSAKEPEKPKDESKTIPLAAHLEERRQHKAEVEDLRKQHQAMMAELEKLKSPPKPPPAEPDFTADPKGYVDTKLGSVLKQLETGTAELKKTTEQADQKAEAARFFQHMQTTEQQFLAQTPDYYEALNHLRGLRAQEIITLHPDITQEQLKQALSSEEIGLAAQLVRAGRNPHQVAYELARARGYTKKAANGAESLLPKVEKPNQLPPDQTLGTGSGSPNAGETFLDDDEVFEKAFNEMFGRKRA